MINLENDYLKVTIALDGAEIRSVFDKSRGIERMWHADAKYWGRTSPVLFPIVGQVKGGSYTFDEKDYNLSQHGFLRDQKFELESSSENQVSFIYESLDKMKDVYPFEHRVTITYTLVEKTVSVTWKVENCDTQEMYYSIGAHPAFNLNGDHYEFEFETRGDVREFSLKQGLVANSEIITVKPVEVNVENLQNDAIIYDNIDAVSLINRDNGELTRLACPGFDYVGLWMPVTDGNLAPFVCIEPWMGITDSFDEYGDFRNKLSIKKLAPEKQESYEYTVSYL